MTSRCDRSIQVCCRKRILQGDNYKCDSVGDMRHYTRLKAKNRPEQNAGHVEKEKGRGAGEEARIIQRGGHRRSREVKETVRR